MKPTALRARLQTILVLLVLGLGQMGRTQAPAQAPQDAVVARAPEASQLAVWPTHARGRTPQVHLLGNLGSDTCRELLVPASLRFRAVPVRELVAAVAATRRLQVIWLHQGRYALLQSGTTDAEIARLKADLAATDAERRLDAVWRAGWIEDVRVLPLLADLAGNADPELALTLGHTLDRLGWAGPVLADDRFAALACAQFAAGRSYSPMFALMHLDRTMLRQWNLLPALQKGVMREDEESSFGRSLAAGWLGDVGGDAAVDILAGLVKSPDDRLMQDAIEGLAHAGGEKAWSIVAGSVTNPELGVRARIAASLVYCPPARALPVLTKLLADPEPAVHRAALLAEARLDPANARKRADADMSSQDARTRELAVKVLRLLNSEDALPLLEKAVNGDEEIDVRTEALLAMVAIGGPKAMPCLERLIAKPDPDLYLEATGCLGTIGNDAALALLEKALADPDEEVRGCAVEALGAAGGERALTLLDKALDDKSAAVQEIAVAALGRIGGAKAYSTMARFYAGTKLPLRKLVLMRVRETVGDDALPLLTKALADTDPFVRDAATFSLGFFTAEKSLPLLEKALADPDGQVRAQAVLALAQLRGPGALALMGKALSDPELPVCLKAVQCVGNYGSVRAADLLIARLAVEEDERVRADIMGTLRQKFDANPKALKAVEEARKRAAAPNPGK